MDIILAFLLCRVRIGMVIKYLRQELNHGRKNTLEL